jgi:predicted nucleic acid-binding protein
VLVVDASVAVADCLSPDVLHELGDEQLAAPPLLWPETRSALRVLAHRGDITNADARNGAERLETLPIRTSSPARLGHEAWRVADELGWVRAYDAEYVALASILGCRLVTVDARLRRGADRLGFVVSPLEL